MTGPPASRAEVEADRLRGLANVGAAEAAAVLAELVGRTVLAGSAQVADAGARAPGERSSGVFFEAEGQLSGVVAILLPLAARDTVLRALLGQLDADPNSEAAESALRELANIVASRTVSAIADSVGARILLSLPKLVMEGAEGALASIASRRVEKGALRIEAELLDCDGSFRSLLVLVADA
jgi:chemotaxis protein CheY-P-specific phosphatase CheC